MAFKKRSRLNQKNNDGHIEKINKTKEVRNDTLPRSKKNKGFVIFLFWLILISSIAFSFFNFYTYLNLGNGLNLVDNLNDNTAEMNAPIDPKLSIFCKDFLNYYINIGESKDKRENRIKVIGTMLANDLSIEQIEDLSKFNGSRELLYKELYEFQKIGAFEYLCTFHYKYENLFKDNKKVENRVYKEGLITLRVKEQNNKFSLVENPYFDSYSGNTIKLDKVSNNMQINELEKEEQFDVFLRQFFDWYTTGNDQQISYMLEDSSYEIKGLSNLFDFVDIVDYYIYSNMDEDDPTTIIDKYIIKAIIKFSDGQANIIENFTIEVKKKDDKLFIQKFEKTIGGV